MEHPNIRFEIRNKKFYKSFDKSKISLGKALYIKEIENGEDIQISDTPFKESTKVGVTWIVPSEWIVILTDSYTLEYADIIAVGKVLNGYLSSEEIIDCLSYLASQLRVEYLYKTKEFENSPLQVIFATVQRLQLINSLKSEKLSDELSHQWEPIIVYHLLTCFDLLGQPVPWVKFDQWLISKKCKDERDRLIEKFNKNLNGTNFSIELYKKYEEMYGVKNSFLKFINEILPSGDRRKLFDSIRIQTNSLPPKIVTLSEDSNDEEKEKLLLSIRHNYTHKSKVIPGFNVANVFGSKMAQTSSMRKQEFTENEWKTFFSANWPTVLEEVVKSGLASYIKKQKPKETPQYKIQTFRYKYYNAFKPDGERKLGINRITYEYRGEEIARDYLESRPTENLEWASIKEVNKHQTIYPHIDHKDLIG